MNELNYLDGYKDEDAMGPVSQTDALFIHSLVRMVVPMTIVEFGFGHGDSARVFLNAADLDCVVHSFDPNSNGAGFEDRPNFRFHQKSMTEFNPEDIEHYPIDLVFFDGAHVLEDDQKAWKRIEPYLGPYALVLVHDTGLWWNDHLLPIHRAFIQMFGRKRQGEGWAHQPDERKFVNWILDLERAWQAVHLHSLSKIRHGITVLQRVGRIYGA